MRRVFALCLLLLVPAAPLTGQDPEPPTDAQVLGIGTDIPGRLTVPVTIAGKGPYPFTIDTGAERTVISRELAARLGLAAGRGVRMTAMTGTSHVGTVVIPSLAVSTAGKARIEAPLLDGEHLGAPGLLGLDSLQGHAVSIDFDKQRMSVAKSRRSGFADYDPSDVIVKAKGLHGQLVVTDAYYRGVRVRVVLDTGSVLSVGNLALRARVARRQSGFQTVGLTSVTGEVLNADYTQIGEVEIGRVKFQNLPVAFADAAPFQQLGLNDKPALLLGMDALRQFRRVDIDFARREVRLALPLGVQGARGPTTPWNGGRL
ncbi:aspartyl protease family protein [Sphingomonas sp.]|uniref:aspartyl protease family protein n=1 Tax=Sphingomonas sp. TaxID=28214 RepID=UPI0035A97801